MAEGYTITEKLELFNVSGEQWYRFIYLVLDAVTTVEACKIHCSYDNKQPCDYIAYDEISKKCYMGNFNVTSPVIPIQTQTLEMFTRTESGKSRIKIQYVSSIT